MKFKSGRKIDANKGLIGINEELEIGTGYDQMLHLVDDDFEDAPLSAEERAELADHMIALWTRYKMEQPK